MRPLPVLPEFFPEGTCLQCSGVVCNLFAMLCTSSKIT